MKINLQGGPNDGEEIEWTGGHVLTTPHVRSSVTREQIEQDDVGFAAVYLQSVLDPTRFMFDGTVSIGNLATLFRGENEADVIARLLFMTQQAPQPAVHKPETPPPAAPASR